MMKWFKTLINGVKTSPMNALGGLVATGFLTIGVLTFTGTIQVFNSDITVTFRNYNDVILSTVRANRGDDVIYQGELPTKPSNGDEMYVFSGWSHSLLNVRTDLDVKALFTDSLSVFQANFINNGQVIYSTNVPYGEPLVYAGPSPSQTSDARFNYQWIGWDINQDGVVDPLPTNTTNHITARAIFIAKLNGFQVTFRNHDQKVLARETFYYGETASYSGEVPFKLPKNGQHFVFTDWLPNLDYVMANFDTTAQFVPGGAVPFIAENRRWQIGDTQTEVNADLFPDLAPYVMDGLWWIGDIPLEIIAEFFSESTNYPFLNDLGNWQFGDLPTNIPFDLSELTFPTLGENGNWFIGDFDTNIQALIPAIGESGNWMFGEYDTKISADGNSFDINGFPFVSSNGNWWIGANDTGIPALGFENVNIDLSTFQNIPFVGPNNNWWIGVTDTGITYDEGGSQLPYIDQNDHWWIDETNTYISASDLQGETPYPYIGNNGNWFIGEVDLQINAEFFGGVPQFSISEAGNWLFGPQDVGILANIISVNVAGNWFIGDFDTGIAFFDTGIMPPYVGLNGNYYFGLFDTGITFYGELNPIDPNPGEENEEEPPFEEQILDSGEYSFGYDGFDFGVGGGTGGGSGGSGGSGGGGFNGQNGICPSNMEVTPIDIKILSIEKTYDGQSINPNSAVLEYDETILESGHRIVVTFEDMGPLNNVKIMPTDVGQYQLRGKFSIVDANNQILKCVYQPNVTFVGNLVINYRTITINTGTVTKVFDDSPLTNNIYSITGDLLAPGHTITLVFTGSQTEVGASVNNLDWTSLVIRDQFGNNVTKNYAIMYNYGMLIVTFA
jgi:hypothetical protein